MGLGAVIAIAGLVSGPVPQALALAAAAIIAPAFEPAAKLTLGLVRGRWYTIRRALVSLAGGYVTLALVGALAYLLLQGLGKASPGVAGRQRRSQDGHRSDRRGLAHLGRRSGRRPGGFHRHAGEPTMALEALRRVGLDVLLVVVLGGAVVLLKQSLVHDNRRPMIEQYQ